jgi:hypothetical protein
MRPNYAWHTLHNRLKGLAHTGGRRLRVDYQTFVALGPNEDIMVFMFEQQIARIEPESVTVWYSHQQSPSLQRRLNDVLRPIGWAVVEREGGWFLVRREDDGGLVHPFPLDVKATVTAEEVIPTYRAGMTL